VDCLRKLRTTPKKNKNDLYNRVTY
jgi:hypothetical protein